MRARVRFLVAGLALCLAAGSDRGAGAEVVARPGPLCTTAASWEPNLRTDCEVVDDGVSYSNETTIAVNPVDPANMVAAANGLQFWRTPGGQGLSTFLSRARASNDGGHTWSTVALDFSGYTLTGDPSVAFDAGGAAYLAVVASSGSVANTDVLVARSDEGGRSWAVPVRVGKGSGGPGSAGVANDKPTVAAWGNGNAVAAWTEVHVSEHGAYDRSPVVASVTHDGGRTWTAPAEVSGSAPFCTGAAGGHTCDQAANAQPVVTADGRVVVLSMATDTRTVEANVGRDTVVVVEISPSSGARVAGPFRVGAAYDGAADYPANAAGEPTLQDSQFRVSSLGNVAADPTRPGHLAAVWSDMRNSPLPAVRDPYQAVTDSDIVVSQSYDAGRTWSQPMALAERGDQFQPWSAYDGAGRLRIGYFDRSYDSANHRYGYTLASEGRPGSLAFASRQVTTALSDPTRDDRLQSRLTVDPSFPHPTPFIGDYSAVAATPTGVVAYWTDLRDTVCFLDRCGAGENTYVVAVP